MLEKKSVAAVIILTLITFGIYGLVWIYKTAKSLQEQGGKSTVSAAGVLLLALFLGFVGYIFLALDADENLNIIRAQRGLPAKDNKVLYLVLAIIIPIVFVGILQNDINELA